MKVLFATKTYGGDWKSMVAGGFKRKLEAVNYPFDSTMLVFNNGISIETGNMIKYLADLTPKVTKFANPYLDGELLAVMSAKGFDYLCFVQGDCITTGGDWITPGIKVLENQPRTAVVSPASEVNTWHNDKGLDHYMSDQAFLVRVSEFSNPNIYEYPGVDPDYPSYGKDSFEHRVGKYLKATGRYRRILSDFWVNHPVT